LNILLPSRVNESDISFIRFGRISISGIHHK